MVWKAFNQEGGLLFLWLRAMDINGLGYSGLGRVTKESLRRWLEILRGGSEHPSFLGRGQLHASWG